MGTMLGLIRGGRGKPTHPPLTDVTIGAYLAGTTMLVLGALDVEADAMTVAAPLAIGGGVALALVTALTGFVDWLEIPIGSPARQVATAHALTMLGATAVFAGAFAAQIGSYGDGNVAGLALALAIAGAVGLLVGGSLGGRLVYGHGVRVEAGDGGSNSARQGEEGGV